MRSISIALSWTAAPDIALPERPELLGERANDRVELGGIDDEVEVGGGPRLGHQADRVGADQRPASPLGLEHPDHTGHIRFAHRAGSPSAVARATEQRTMGREDPHRLPDRLGDSKGRHDDTIPSLSYNTLDGSRPEA